LIGQDLDLFFTYDIGTQTKYYENVGTSRFPKFLEISSGSPLADWPTGLMDLAGEPPRLVLGLARTLMDAPYSS
jgi:hypothetical protein